MDGETTGTWLEGVEMLLVIPINLYYLKLYGMHRIESKPTSSVRNSAHKSTIKNKVMMQKM
jgi:hypothetical protein